MLDYEQKFLTTQRLKTAYYRAGEGNPRKLLMIHGNVSSSDVYLPLFPELSKHFDVVAADLRCFGDSDALPIDATRGFRDWSDDVDAFVAALGWDKFVMCGWSMGGCVTMQYLIDHSEKLAGIILIAPGSPYGYGGTKGLEGTPLDPPGLASGAGCVNPTVVQALMTGDINAMNASIDGVFVKPPFQMDPEWKERIAKGMLKTKVGEGMYPGDVVRVPQWPGVAAGTKGVCNTMAPTNANLSVLVDAPNKPAVLWFRGDSDIMVSDTCPGDFGFLGMTGMVPGWPGADVIPPQPMIGQTRAVLEKYQANGGSYKELVVEGGHAAHLEHPDVFNSAVVELFG